MAYRAELTPRKKGSALAVVVALHGALLFAILHMPGTINPTVPQSALSVFDVRRPEPPPPPPVRRVPARQKPGGSAPRNVSSQATPAEPPKPRTEPLGQTAASEIPDVGAQSTTGASEIPGPGSGAGGNGTGGTGGSGAGGSGAGTLGMAVSASLIRGIFGADYPEAIRRSWPRGGVIYTRIRVEPNGRPSRCDVMRSFGDSLADQWTCALLMQRSEFRPALDVHGTPIAAWIGYKQVDISR